MLYLDLTQWHKYKRYLFDVNPWFWPNQPQPWWGTLHPPHRPAHTEISLNRSTAHQCILNVKYGWGETFEDKNQILQDIFFFYLGVKKSLWYCKYNLMILCRFVLQRKMHTLTPQTVLSSHMHFKKKIM